MSNATMDPPVKPSKPATKLKTPPVAPPPPPAQTATVEKPKPVPPPPAPAPTLPSLEGRQVIYGGRPAYQGVDVWYCLLNVDGSGHLRACPAKLYERGSVNPDLWMVSIQYGSGVADGMWDVPFSEVPKEGHWCWPVVPELPKATVKAPETPPPG